MTTGWEYMYIKTLTNDLEKFTDRLNDLGAEGWEAMVTTAEISHGPDVIIAVLKRPLVPLPPPQHGGETWWPDPAGRFDKRFYSGRAWTPHVGREADKSTHRDPPTLMPPTPPTKV